MNNEMKIQAECFIWHWNNFPEERGMLHHNNNNSVNYIVGNRMKSMGVVKGVTDFELILPGGIVAWIEMKTPIGRLSEDQIKFRDKIIKRGHFHFVIRTTEEFKNLIKTLYENR